MPAVLRARRRVRPGGPGDLGGARRRRLGDQRPEGVDQPGPPRAVGPAAGAIRSRRPEAPGPHLLRARHARPRRRVPAAAADDRAGRVQRGVHHRRQDPRRPPARRRRRRLAGRHDHADERAQRPGRQRQPARVGDHLRGGRAVGLASGPAHAGVARPADATVASLRSSAPDLGALTRVGDGRRSRPGGVDRQDGGR